MEKQILEGNKLIAEFMGAVKEEHDFYRFPNPFTVLALTRVYALTLRYHEGWDWIMPVIEKIDKTPVLSNKDEEYYYCVELGGSVASILDAFTGKTVIDISLNETNWLELTYQLVVKFINWYNENK